MRLLKRKKQVDIPDGSTTESKTALKVWTVQWVSRFGEYSGSTQKEFEAFTDEQEARDFKKALEDAFTLIRHTSNTRVNISCNE